MENFTSNALRHFAEIAKKRKESALSTIQHILRMSDISNSDYDKSLSNIQEFGRIALHFHPDRFSEDGSIVVDKLIKTGQYHGQFITKLSNGKVSTEPNGDRDNWEKALFGGAYHKTCAFIENRPKYGALALYEHGDGPAPRFGSCYFLLKPNCSKRSTFTYLDSHTMPEQRGTISEFHDIYSCLLMDIFSMDFALGEKETSIGQLIETLLKLPTRKNSDWINFPIKRNLNHYIEAQLHGDILLEKDVDCLVCDSSFINTELESKFKTLAEKFNVELYWKPKLLLKVTEVPSNFRGNTMPAVGERASINGEITAYTIGLAIKDLHENPENWKDLGTLPDSLQELKLIWHVLVRYGEVIL